MVPGMFTLDLGYDQKMTIDLITRSAMGMVVGPLAAIVIYGSARILAMILVRIIPESRLKRRLFTDADTGRLAYTPKVRREGVDKHLTLRGR